MSTYTTTFHKSHIIEDEVALEGLDGITLQALWIRLSSFKEFCGDKILTNENLKCFVWYLARQIPVIEFYQLPEPRSHLKVFNRYDYVEEEFGTIMEQEEKTDVYPICYIEDKNILGSCSTYEIRQIANVRYLSYKEVNERYGDTLVLVANQRRRNAALGVDEKVDVNCSPLTQKEYVLLERIGRSRSLGELSHGKNSIAVMRETPKSLFYLRKRLLQLSLIIKQPHRQKSLKGTFNCASLFHLNRFYVERKSKLIIMIETLIREIKKAANNMCSFATVKEILKVPPKVRKQLFESSEFQKFIKSVMVPYEQVFPQYVQKSRNKTERMIRFFTLVDPNITAEDVTNPVEDENHEDDDNEFYPKYINIENQAKVIKSMCRCIGPLNYAYDLAKQAGPDGVTQLEIANAMGLTKLDARSVCRTGVHKDLLCTVMKDMGRQRVTRYVAQCYSEKGGITGEYNAERQKMFSYRDVKPSLQDAETNPFCAINTDADLDPLLMDHEQIEKCENVVATLETSQSEDFLCQPSTSDVITNNVMSNISIISKDPSIASEIIEEPHLADRPVAKMMGLINKSQLTARIMKRANIILDMLRKQKIIDGYVHLTRSIVKSEQEEGCTSTMDKKSLLTLINRLALSGMVKLIKVKLKRESFSKTINYLVEPSLTRDSPEFLERVECSKQMFLMKSLLHGHRSKPIPESTILPDMDELSVGDSVQKLKKMNDRISSASNVKRLSTNKGVGSKFVRMRELHHMLFYLVYDYSGSEDLDQDIAWKSITRIHGELQEDIIPYPRIFSTERSWKMFIPPLPKHVTTTAAGWVFVVDVLLRLPLCLFVCIVNVSSYEEELRPYLNHPIKKFLLVKDLPEDIRQLILRGRRYVTYIMELLHRLCHIGLVQLGNQILKEKDHVFIYINRNAILVDTTTTRPSYYQISMEKGYVRDHYYLEQFQDVISFWLDMETICLHTPLGCHSTADGKDITFDQVTRRPNFSSCMSAQNIDEAPLRDCGYIPGDGLGAAGLDSSLYSHLRRNWCLKTNKFYSTCQISSHPKPQPVETPSSESTSTLYAKYLKNSATGESNLPNSRSRLSNMKKYKLTLYKPKGETPVPIQIKTDIELSKRRKKRKHIQPSARKSGGNMVRFIKNARKKGPAKKPYYDELDRAALKRMKKLRVEWSTEEDSMLLMCRVASMKLFPNRRGQISFLTVRDQLYARVPTSLNKTSRACQRRVNYMLKDRSTERNLAILLEEVMIDPSIKKEFKPMKVNPIADNLSPEILSVFSKLLDQVVLKFKSPHSKKCLNLPDSYEKISEMYNIHTSTSLKMLTPLYDVKSIDDIDYYVVYSLMFSCLCTLQDRESWGYQLYLAYQKYSQALLEKVLMAIRQSKMTSFKKHCRRNKQPRKCLPLTTSPYQLSLCFIYLFTQRYQYEVFSECWDMLNELVKSKEQSFQMLSECSAQDANHVVESDDMFDSPETNNRKRKKKQLSERPCKVTKLDVNNLIIAQDCVGPELEEIVLNMENIEVEEKSIDMSSQNNGGNAAAIISLMASNRIYFDITIPDQLFVLREKAPEAEVRSSLLKRAQNLEEFSGRKSLTWDINIAQPKENNIELCKEKNNLNVEHEEPLLHDSISIMEYTSDLLPSTVEQSANITSAMEQTSDLTSVMEQTSDLTSVMVQTADLTSVLEQTSDLTSVREQTSDLTSVLEQTSDLTSVMEQTSDLTSVMEQAPNLSDNAQMDYTNSIEILPASEDLTFDDQSTKVDTATISRSRVIMHMMKSNVLLGLTLDASEIERDDVDMQPCKINVSLKLPVTLDTVPVITTKELSQFYLPCNQEILDKALAKREKVIIIEPVNVEGLWSSDLIKDSDVVLAFIETCKDIGATAVMLKEEFKDKLSLPTMEVLHNMEEANFVWRMGVEVPRWISSKYVSHWLIHTNKIPRHTVKSEEKFRVQGVYDITSNVDRPPVNQSVNSTETAADVNNPIETLPEHSALPEDCEDDESFESKAKKLCTQRRSARIENKIVCGSTPTKDENVTTHLVPSRFMTKKLKTVSSEIVDKEKQINETKNELQYAAIDVAVRPWVRLNGSLNRRVMDRFMGAILTFVIENPGSTGKKISMRFWPGVIPAHSYELLQTLLEIGCVRGYRLDCEEVDIFSEQEDIVHMEDVEDYDFDEDFAYEPTSDGIIRHSMFIGKKKYSVDFLKQCR